MPGFGEATGTSSCGLTADAANTEFFANDCMHGRHFGGINMAYADGHVKWLKSSTVIAEALKYYTSPAPKNSWDPANS